MKVVVDVSGGLDACFEGSKEFKLEVPEASKMRDLINQLKSICNPKRLDFLVSDDQSLRPGILVLINDVDWELEDKEEYVLQPNDRISLISTLHGG